MLFLAATRGLSVENQREHYIEHQREKKYAAQLYQELKFDTLVVLTSLKDKATELTKELQKEYHIK